MTLHITIRHGWYNNIKPDDFFFYIKHYYTGPSLHIDDLNEA